MRAAGVTEFGGPEALHLVDVPAEPLGPGQVRLRVPAATVNPTDTYARAGAYAERDPVKAPPWVPGMDVAGVVAEVGEGVDAPRGRRRRDGHRRPDRARTAATGRTWCCPATRSSGRRRAPTPSPRPRCR